MTDTNNKNLIKISQIALMLLLILEGSKVINLPSYVARESGRDGWLTYVILLAMDAAVLVALLLTVKKTRSDFLWKPFSPARSENPSRKSSSRFTSPSLP